MTIQLSENYPKLIRDLFLYDVGAQYYPSEELTCDQIFEQIAYMPIDLGKSVDYKAMLDEAIELPYIQSSTGADRCYMYGTCKRLVKCTYVSKAFQKRTIKLGHGPARKVQ